MGDGDAFALERFSWTKNAEKIGVDLFTVRGLGVRKIAVVDRINIAMNRVAAAEWAVDNDFENLVQILCEIHIFIIAQKWGKIERLDVRIDRLLDCQKNEDGV